ncbi:MAG: hypothetical protein ACK5WO_07260 [Cyclobacteriaceae bacterium]
MKNKLFSLASLLLMAGALVFLSGCDNDDPEPENVPEVVTKVILSFTPTGSTTAITVTANDPDGEGPQSYVFSGPAALARNTAYNLSISLLNELADPMDEEYNIGLEVKEEADEHLFFFGWTGPLFSNPAGNGNIDNRADAVNYTDTDSKGLPLGLTTSWTTANASATGTLRIILKHQPDIKTSTSTATDGESDLDVTFNVTVN